jgi:hypothetical protein
MLGLCLIYQFAFGIFIAMLWLVLFIRNIANGQMEKTWVLLVFILTLAPVGLHWAIFRYLLLAVVPQGGGQ